MNRAGYQKGDKETRVSGQRVGPRDGKHGVGDDIRVAGETRTQALVPRVPRLRRQRIVWRTPRFLQEPGDRLPPEPADAVSLPDRAVEGRAVLWRAQPDENGKDGNGVGHEEVDERGAEPEGDGPDDAEDEIFQ